MSRCELDLWSHLFLQCLPLAERLNGAMLTYISHAIGLLMHCYIVSLETRTNDTPLTPAQPCHRAVFVAALLLAVDLMPAGARVTTHTQRAANRRELAPVFDQYASLITSATSYPS